MVINKMEDKIVQIICDDWIAIYIDGELYAEGHEIQPEEMLKIGQKYPTARCKTIYINELEQETLELWSFPEDLNKLPKEVCMRILALGD